MTKSFCARSSSPFHQATDRLDQTRVSEAHLTLEKVGVWVEHSGRAALTQENAFILVENLEWTACIAYVRLVLSRESAFSFVEC